MKIMIVDDLSDSRLLLEILLHRAGFSDVALAASGEEALEMLDAASEQGPPSDIDLVLLDLYMPGMNGIEVCRRIKGNHRLHDIPIIMVTAEESLAELGRSFEAGAMDYITKPITSAVLVARVRSALRLKEEMDRRKARERELLEMHRRLEEANLKLRDLASSDGLTGIANRRLFDERLELEWQRAQRSGEPIGLILMDIDQFKAYNDGYGHLQGDDCLRQVVGALQQALPRRTDLIARYGGEEFAALLPATAQEETSRVAERLRGGVEALALEHAFSNLGHVTVSLGAASRIPQRGGSPIELIAMADEALYSAKQGGRNRVATPHGSR